VWYGKSYYRQLIGNHTLAFDWCHFWWPWSTLEGHFSLGCHFPVHFSYPWHAFASHGLPAIAELVVQCVLLNAHKHHVVDTSSLSVCSAWLLCQVSVSMCPVDSAPSLEVYYFLSLTLTVCMSVSPSVTVLLQIDSSFLFLDGIEPFFDRQFSMWHSTKIFFDFWFRPLNPKIYSPKFGTKSPICRLVWQIDRKCLWLLGGFLGWPIQWNHAKCCGADPCCHGNDILANFGYVFHKIVYKLACMPYTPDMFGPTRGDDQGGQSLLPWQRHLH